MCLDTVERVYKRPSKREVVGYKVLKVGRTGVLRTVPRGFIVKPGVWMKSDNHNWDTSYPLGFHVYQKKENAFGGSWYGKGTGVFQVKLRRLVAIGQGDGLRYYPAQYVAMEMKVGKRVFPVSHARGR